jgi:hypothetical protein
MENLLLGNQLILLNDDIDFDQLKSKVSQMYTIIVKFIRLLESICPEYNEMLTDSLDKFKSWESNVKKTDAPKTLLMSEFVQYISHIKKEIESQQINFDLRKDIEYINTLFNVDTSSEYEPLYLLRPIAIDFISLWVNPVVTNESKLQIVSYLYLINEFGRSIMDSFLIIDKEEFQDKYGFDMANFDLDNMNFSINSISDSFAKMLKKDDETMNTTPLTETVNTVLTTFLGIDDASKNINLSTLQELHSKAQDQSKGLYDKLDEISAKLDEKGISDTDLINSVKNLSAAFTKNSNVKNPKIKELFEKLSSGDISDPTTLAECQQMMQNNPLFKSMGLPDLNQFNQRVPVKRVVKRVAKKKN